MSRILRVFVMAMAVAALASVTLGDDLLRVGANAPPSIVGNFVSGAWSDLKAACPVLKNHDERKIAVYVRQLNEKVLPLIEAIDGIVAEDDSLKWSYVFVSHENSPTPSEEDYTAELKKLKKTASDLELKSLSLGLLLRMPDTGKAVSAKRRFGFFGDGDVVVMFISPDDAKHRGVIRYVQYLKSDDIDKGVIDRMTEELKAKL